jgi:hypothetical protein
MARLLHKFHARRRADLIIQSVQEHATLVH